jgi:hypothetical protein
MLPRIVEDEEMQNNNQLAIIAIVAALGVLGVIVVTVAVTIPLQQAEAKGCIGNNFNSRAINASQGRCARP